MEIDPEQTTQTMDIQDIPIIAADLQHQQNLNNDTLPQRVFAGNNTLYLNEQDKMSVDDSNDELNTDNTLLRQLIADNKSSYLNEQEMLTVYGSKDNFNNDNMLPRQSLADNSSLNSMDEEMICVDDSINDHFRSEAIFSYVAQNVTPLKEKEYSPAVFVRMLPWKILVVPNLRGLGFFIQCNGDDDLCTWSCNANVELCIKSHKPNVPPFARTRIKHLFAAKDNDFGYANFITWQELGDPEKCYIYHGCVKFEVHIVADAPHGIMWDSKKHTGYVGLKNQGATCYMNSLLQTLYFTNQLRKAVYKIPTEADESFNSVGLSLQRVFYDLQFGDRPAVTKILTKSFGWDALESFMQHDVQEFLRVLLDKLETTMKGTTLQGTMSALFEGKMSSYIKCKNVNYKSTRYETFYDIQLNIKDKRNMYDSFQDYITSESLDGDNKYDAGVYGLQEASKGVIFTAFPPVLHLHLMRFQYDPIIDSSIKYNDRFEFYEQINLDEFLLEKEKTPADYVLHAVLVHSGDNHGGHYVVFINPKADGKWFKFDDDVVSSCSKTEAIHQNYGGMEDEKSFQPKCSNAYMLVYIRLSELSRVLAEVTEQDIPTELIERLDMEERLEMASLKYFIESEFYITINIFTEDLFELHQKRKLFTLESAYYHTIRVKQTSTVNDMMNIISKAFCTPKDRMRVWTVWLTQFQNVLFYDLKHEGNRLLEKVTTPIKPWSIFLQIVPPDHLLTMPSTFDAQKEVFMFFKFYDAANKCLNYIGCSQQPLDRLLADIILEVNVSLGFGLSTKLKVFDECTQKYVNNVKEPLKNILSLFSDNLQGYILVFEKDYQATKLELPTVQDYLVDLMFRIEVIFCDKCNPNEPEIVLELSNRYTYKRMVLALSERLNIDPNKIQLFACVGNFKDSPGNAIPYAFEGTIKDLINCSNNGRSKKFFYQTLSLSIDEIDYKEEFKCFWVSNNLKEEKELVLYSNKNETVKELLREAAKKVQFSANSQRKLRLLKVSNHKIVTVFKEDALVQSIQKRYESMSAIRMYKKYRIEEIPADELQLTENEMLVPVLHFNKHVCNVFGVPFLIKIKKGETYGTVKQRIQKRLNVNKKEWATYELTLICSGYIIEIYDNSVVDLSEFNTWRQLITSALGLEHINKHQF